MSTTIQKPKPLKAAEFLTNRYWSTIGNPSLLKVRVFCSPKGRQLALILESESLTVFTEPAYDVSHPTSAFHKRHYPEGKSPNHDLNFAERRLGKAFAADCWSFPGPSEFEEFADWYGAQ